MLAAMKHQPRRSFAGLTLLELAIAIAVMAILGSLALPPFAARLSRERLSRAAETLSADISEARFQAARKGHALHLRSQAGGDWCWSSLWINRVWPSQAQTAMNSSSAGRPRSSWRTLSAIRRASLAQPSSASTS